jgi:eukaryotic-like serine/threonine-protein kinase
MSKSPRKFGRYVVEQEIGDGAMGRVYRCADPLMKRLVAVKTVKQEYLTRETAEDYLRRFRREAQAAGRLSHPNIVAIYDVGETYFVMEYLEGTTLQAVLAGRGKLPLDEALRLLTPLADALDYAHRSQIVHRDIKPANIMVLDDGRPKLMDFGVARLESSVATASGHFFGSPSYMAPEQISGAPVTSRADLFSFAVLSYEVVTGRRPFEGDSITAVMYRVVNEDPPPPRRWDFELPASYDAIFRRALSKAPADRYPDAASLVAALQLKDIDSELEALTEFVAPEVVAPPGPPPALVPMSTGELETRDLRDDSAAARGAAGPRRTWAWLAGAVLLALAAGAATYLREDPVAAVAPPVSPRAGPATFRVEAEPAGARVWVDEADVGRAPIALPVSGGRHKVRVAVDGYAPAELSLDIIAGTAPPPLRFVLERMTVRLAVTSQPSGATVRVDGRSIGVAPITTATVPPGRHELRIEKPGFAPSVQEIEGAAGEVVEVNARLTRLSAGGWPRPAPSPEWIPYEGALVALDGSVSLPREIPGRAPAPPYPDEARRMNLLGTVKVEMIVSEKGQPTDLRVVQSAGEILDRAVVDAVRTWRYEPAVKSGVRVKVRWSYTHRYIKQ